jgi:hypothetical protein
MQPKWAEGGRTQPGQDITARRERAMNEYRQAKRTKDDTQGALEEAGKYNTAKYEACGIRTDRDFARG